MSSPSNTNNNLQYVDLNSLGEDAIKAGIFFGAGLMPKGSFSNIPNYYIASPTQQQQASITLTLQNIKDALKAQLEQQTGTSNYSDQTIESFLYDFTSLLIDYSDMRNYIFFGSAYTEIAYNIKTLIDIFPYQTLISDLTSSFTNIQLISNNSLNQTDIIFTQASIKDQGSFSFFDDNANFNVNNYEIVDSNQKRYPIANVVLPFKSSSIFSISNIQNSANGIVITTSTNHNYIQNNIVQIVDFNYTLLPNELTNNIIGKSFLVSNVTANSFVLVDQNNITTPTVMNFVYNSGGETRLYPLIANTQPYSFKIVVNGIITTEQLINYTSNIDNLNYSGLIISPTLAIINDFYFNLSPIQNMLLSPYPINSTPWPIRQITNNIQNKIDQINPADNDAQFIAWLQNSSLLYLTDGSDTDSDISFFNNPLNEYRLVRALGLDETTTNQLIRRCIPYPIISEINDTSNGYFQRFILIAGWMFDQVYVYMKFIKYIHTLNYSAFDQLSPNFYKYYASYYGFELFQDDSIDFSKLIIRTEPGLSYSADSSLNINNKYYQSTLQALEYEKQKRLLLSLLYLYKKKGTQACIKQLVSLLGAPDGLLVLNEYKIKYANTDNLGYIKNYSNSSELLTVDNNKVNVPKFNFEIDPDYLIDKTNVSNLINQPYVYRTHLQNDSEVNLRQLSIQTNPNGAIDYQVINSFGNSKYNYVKLSKNQFLNCQDINNPFYFIPLSFPDKFFGFSVNYMIKRDGYTKTPGYNDLEEASIHLCSLFLIGAPSYKSTSGIASIQLSNANTTALITTTANHQYITGDKIEIINSNGITGINNITFIIASVPTNNSFTITGSFTGVYTNGGYVVATVPQLVNQGFNYSYLLPEVFSNYSNDTILSTNTTNPVTDFNLLQTTFNTSINYSYYNPYIICRLEGSDLVIRLRINSEINSHNYERVCIAQNIFSNDGLNHLLRFIIRAEGIEVYQDYQFITIAKWLDPTSSNAGIPYLAFEIPKKDILTCDESILPINDIINITQNNVGTDKIRWWDMFIGLPQNVNVYFKKIDVFENIGIDSFNIGDAIVNSLNYNVDTYSFDFSNTNETTNYYLTTQTEFLQANPNIENSDYSYLLPISQNANNINVINALTLTSKYITLNDVSQKFFPNLIQDFFNSQNIFQDFGWSNTLHKDYTYNNFNGKLINLYNIFSNLVLTYNQLSSFLDLVESRFKNTIEQFIPIVINISEFGRLIVNSYFNQPKIHYTNIEQSCIGNINASNSFVQSRIFASDQNSPTDGVLINKTLTFSVKHSNNTNLINPFTVPFDESIQNTLTDIQNAFQNTTNNSYYPNIKPSVLGNVFRLEINYNWYLSNFAAEDANTLTFIVTDGTNTKNILFSNGTLGTIGSSNSCFYLLRQLPVQALLPPLYIYFASEKQNNPYIGFAFETSQDASLQHFIDMT